MGSLDFLFQGTPPTQVTNTGQTTTNVPQWLQEYAQGILSEGASVASQPYPQYGGPTVAGLSQPTTQAGNTVSNLQGAYQPTLTSAINLASGSSNPSALTTALGMTPQASALIQGSVNPNAAQINPYVNNVINQAKDQATQYWQNTLQPSINNQFTSAGQFGSSANQRAANQGATQVTQNIQDTANSALAQAYGNAQQANLGAGTALGSLAGTTGGLGYEGGMLGLQGAGALGSLATTGQNLGLQGASALDAYGQEVQGNQQANLNSALGQFQQQQQYPYQQLGWLSQLMNGTIQGTTPGGYTTNQQAVPAQQGSGTTPAGNIIGGLASLFGSPAARGGRIMKYRRGGRVRRAA